MTSFNLTRDTAAERASHLTVTSYRIRLDVTQPTVNPADNSAINFSTAHDVDNISPTTHFRSHTTIEVDCTTPGYSTFLDLRDVHLISATLNGESLDVDAYNTTLSASGETGENGLLLPSLAAHNTIDIDAWCHYSTTGEGLHRAVDAADGTVYLYSQCEPADSKRVFACFDQPDLKAPIDLTVTAPAGWEIISNSSIATSTPAESPIYADVDAVTHHFQVTNPLCPYVFALCAGPYHRWSDTYHWHGDDGREITIPLNLYCRETLAPYFDPDNIFALTKGGFDYYHRTFGILYPFTGSYDQVFVPDFNAGAMENVGCVTYREDYVFRSRATAWKYERRADTVLHEMAHMWFGNLVTMQWWNDLWLNESFASWASVMAQLGSTTYQTAWTTFTSTEKNWAYRQDDLPSTHPIAATMESLEELDANFDGITYAKGCSVLKQFVAYAGLDPFLKGLHDYLLAHSYGNATFQDLLDAVSVYCDKDFRTWAEAWLTTTGRNTLSLDFDIASDPRDNSARYSSVTLHQTGAEPGAGELRPHRVGVGVYAMTATDSSSTDNSDTSVNLIGTDSAGTLVRTHYAEVDLIDEWTDIPELHNVLQGALLLPNDEDLTYCQLELDPQSIETVVEHIEDIVDPLPRALCWGVLEEMTMHATLPGSALIEVIARAIGSESELPVAEHLMSRALQVLRFFADPKWAEMEGWRLFSDALLTIAQQPSFGVDQQLIAFTTFCQCKLNEDQTRLLWDIWAAQSLEPANINDLQLDTDLRWTVLTALAAHGLVTQYDIDTALANDNTSMGVRRALTAGATLPTPENKAAVWEKIFAVDGDVASNWSVVALLDGFAWAGQDALVAPFANQYPTDVVRLWQKRGGEVASTVTERAFPLWGDAPTVQRLITDMLAAENDLPSGAQRFLREGLFDLARAQKGRALEATTALDEG